jgi:hypothetical protein
MPQKRNAKRIFFSKQDASRSATEVQTFFFKNGVKIFAADLNEQLINNFKHFACPF